MLTSDPAIGMLWPGDVLVRGRADRRRRAVLSRRWCPDHRRHRPHHAAGFVDTHRHTWQSIVRTIASDWTLTDYFVGLHSGLSKHFRAQDTYAGNLLGALEALDSGITTLVDWSHNLYTPGARGRGRPGAAGHRDARRVRPRRWRAPVAGAAAVGRAAPGGRAADPGAALRLNDGLVTMALALRGPQFATEETNRGDFALANDLGLRVTVHVGDGDWGKTGRSSTCSATGCCPTGTRTSTATRCPTRSWTSSASSGGTASVAPDVEMQMGHGWPATGRLLAHGIRPTFSIDVCSSNGGDMFGTMRTAIGAQRALDNQDAVAAMRAVEKVSISCKEVVSFATLDGAVAAGLGEVTGSLTPGKQADLIILGGDSLALNPVNNPFGAVVYAAHPGHVRDVMVAGAWRKRDGKLVDVDVQRVLQLARESRDHVFREMPEAALGGEWVPAA